MSTSNSDRYSVLSAMFLVAGTCIGGGMLALPVSTGISGFIPSLLVMLISWAAMTITGLLLLEVSLWLGEGAHFITMSKKFLGSPGKVICWILYLFIGYASIIAYTAAGGDQITDAVSAIWGWHVSKLISCLIFIVVFGFIVDFGAKVVGRINTILFFGLIGAYFLITFIGISEVKLENVSHSNWSFAFMGIPIILTSFSFQTMVPSLTPYLKRNPKYLRWSVIGGTTITLLIYVVWQFLILGILPATGPDSLAEAFVKGGPATPLLRKATMNYGIIIVAEFFSFFAIVTSFLGITLGLFDFLSDGLKIEKKGFGKVCLGLLIAIPTLFFAIYYERAFLVALDATGGYGDTILSGIFPILMVWIGRYKRNLPEIMKIPGGKATLALTFLFFLLSFFLELLVHLGIISSLFDVTEIHIL